MLVEFGTIAFLLTMSLVLLFTRLTRYWKRKVLENPLTCDISIFTIVYWLHMGSFSGGMIAALAAFFTSLCLSTGRWWYRIGQEESNLNNKEEVRDKREL